MRWRRVAAAPADGETCRACCTQAEAERAKSEAKGLDEAELSRLVAEAAAWAVRAAPNVCAREHACRAMAPLAAWHAMLLCAQKRY